jgi:hypothetical protein
MELVDMEGRVAELEAYKDEVISSHRKLRQHCLEETNAYQEAIKGQARREAEKEGMIP